MTKTRWKEEGDFVARRRCVARGIQLLRIRVAAGKSGLQAVGHCSDCSLPPRLATTKPLPFPPHSHPLGTEIQESHSDSPPVFALLGKRSPVISGGLEEFGTIAWLILLRLSRRPLRYTLWHTATLHLNYPK